MAFGTVMIYNITAVFASGTLGSATRLVLLHITWLALGLVGFLIFWLLDYSIIKRFAFPLFIITLLILAFLAIAGILPCTDKIIFAPCIYGANRWFFINPAPLPALPFIGILGFQPSELGKLALVFYLAVILEKNNDDDFTSFIVYIVVTGLIALLILAQPNMSTAMIIFFIGTAMFFAADVSIKPLLISFPPLALIGSLFIFLSSYRRARLMTFLSGEATDTLGSGYHIQQILISLGSGGIFGVGLGQSIQKFEYVPEVVADSIFAIIGEELGFVGTVFFIVLFAFFIFRCFEIAKNAPDMFGRLLAMGITCWLAGNFMVNISAMTALIPLTGIPIPLVSYGGSNTLFSLIGLGVLANISSQSKV